MSLAYLLCCVNVLFCGVNSGAVPWTRAKRKFNPRLPDSSNFDFSMQKVETHMDISLKEPVLLEEGSEYIVKCQYEWRDDTEWDLHWEVEPYGLRSLAFSTFRKGKRNILMVLKLFRDDKLIIRCHANNTNFGEINESRTFLWDEIERPESPTPPLLLDATNDAEQKCCEINNIQKCAFFTRNKWSRVPLVEMQIYTTKKKYGWAPVVAGFAGVAMLLVLCFICYWFLRKRKQNEPTCAEPAVVYAELQLESNGQLRQEKRGRGKSHYAKILMLKSKKNEPKENERGGEKSHYAKILRFKFKKNEPKKNEPKLKNASENIQSKTEDTRIGTVELNNDLYSNSEDARIGTVERINDLYSTAGDTRIGNVERINDLYSTASESRIGTVEQINDLYSTATETRKDTLDHNLYSTVWC